MVIKNGTVALIDINVTIRIQHDICLKDCFSDSALALELKSPVYRPSTYGEPLLVRSKMRKVANVSQQFL